MLVPFGTHVVDCDGKSVGTVSRLLTSPAASGTPTYVRDPDAPESAKEPAIAKATPVYDNAGRHLGEVDGVEIDPASDRITRVIVRRGLFFHTETPVPAGWIALVRDRLILSVDADRAKTLEPVAAGRPGPAPSR